MTTGDLLTRLEDEQRATLKALRCPDDAETCARMLSGEERWRRRMPDRDRRRAMAAMTCLVYAAAARRHLARGEAELAVDAGVRAGLAATAASALVRKVQRARARAREDAALKKYAARWHISDELWHTYPSLVAYLHKRVLPTVTMRTVERRMAALGLPRPRPLRLEWRGIRSRKST